METVTAQDVLALLEKSGHDVSQDSGTAEEAQSAFEDLLDLYDIPGISVIAEQDGKDVIVSFSDEKEGIIESVVFSVTDEEVTVHKLPSGDDLDEETEVMDLSGTDATIDEDGNIDFSNIKWNKMVMQSIFNMAEGDVDEKTKMVIRDGKKVKITVKLKKKKQTAKQKAASRKRKGKKKSAAAIRKQKKSAALARKLA